jgi:nitroreductase
VPDQLLEPYLEAIDEFPLTGRAAEKLRSAVRNAVLAPSGHNSQPWLFRVRRDALDLLADRTRALPVVDPYDRELTISCGAALFNLLVTLRHFGTSPTVDLFPKPAAPDILARVRLGGAYEPTAEEHALFRAIARRRTFRFAFKDRVMSEALLGALQVAAAREGAWLHILGDDRARGDLADLIAQGDRLQMANPAFRRELAAWVNPNRSRSRDGIPGYALGFGDIMSAVGPLVIRTFDLGEGRAARDRELALGSPVLAILGTPGDTPHDWLTAGLALERVLLRATVDGVAASFLNQPLEVPELRAPVARLVGRDGSPQALLRFGYAEDIKATPRRPIDDVLIG